LKSTQVAASFHSKFVERALRTTKFLCYLAGKVLLNSTDDSSLSAEMQASGNRILEETFSLLNKRVCPEQVVHVSVCSHFCF
jgi:hypothetical protein